jgi:phosphoribosylaminoimidazolecarboxamide formyltransferase/IMP cyclohydrolase
VKTLHPKIHGGILGRRDLESDAADMQANDIAGIDLVVVNLYPFEQTIAQPGTTFAEGIEKIDIGGPSMLRSAAKNHDYVGVVCDPTDYPKLLAEIDADGGLSLETRQGLALKAFRMTAAYDAAIQTWLAEQTSDRVGQDEGATS